MGIFRTDLEDAEMSEDATIGAPGWTHEPTRTSR